MQKVDLFIQIRATNHDKEAMSVRDWKDIVWEVLNFDDVDVDLEVIRINVDFA